MRVVAGQMPELTEEFLLFAAQLGLPGVQLNTPNLPGDGSWDLDGLVAARRRCADYGLKLEAIENIPIRWYDDVMLGGPRRDNQIENVLTTIRHLAEAEIPILGYAFMPHSVWRTGVQPTGRGGAVVTTYDHSIAADPDRQDEVWVARRDDHLENTWVAGAASLLPPASVADMWDRHEYFMSLVLPIAEREGVTLALHPDDPPVPMLGGVGRIFTSVADLRRAADTFTSPAWGMDLCLGTVSEMGGEETVLAAIDYLGPRSKIVYAHLRDVHGSVPVFSECFLGEGNYDPLRVLRALRDSGFDGFILDDHVPQMTGDSDYMHRGRAHAIGYLQALLRIL